MGSVAPLTLCARMIRFAPLLSLAPLALPAAAPAFEECQRIADDEARLACYDQVQQDAEPPAAEPPPPPVPAQPAPPPTPAVAPPVTPASPAPVPTTPPAATAPQAPAADAPSDVRQVKVATPLEAFGAETLPVELKPLIMPEEQLTAIDAQVVRFKRNALDQVMVWLDNGQVWQQLGTRDLLFDYKGEKDLPYAVTIKRKWLSGYRMTAEKTRATVTVKRIR